MKTPPRPQNDVERVTSLHALHILDTAPELKFNQLTKLAQRLLRVPISLISLVDDERQWVKSSQGLSLEEAPRDISLCAHTILQDDVFVITDTHQNQNFADNPLVLHDPKIRFYAGCPIASTDGNKVGSFCVIDREPRSMTHAELQLLRDLSDVAENEMNQDLTDSITGLNNDKALLAILRHVLNFSRRTKQPVSGLFMRLSNLHEINKNFGNKSGDVALIRTAEIMVQTFRGSDVSSRIGSSKFCVILPQCPEKEVETALNRFEKKVAEFNQMTTLPFHLEFDVGHFSCDPDSPEPIEKIIQRTEQLVININRDRFVSRI